MVSKATLIKLTVFLSGLQIMVLELVGSRILAPSVGTSIFTWTSLIAIILASLSLGYFLGGKAADIAPSFKTLSRILLIGGLLIGLTTVVNGPLLKTLSVFAKDIRTASVLSTLILFAPASVFLGMVTPVAMKLQISKDNAVGATIGNLNALGALGSITGTFLAGFFLISYLGSQQILLLLCGISLLLSMAINFDKKIFIIFVLIFLALEAFISFKQSRHLSSSPWLVLETDTDYSHVQILDLPGLLQANKRVRILQINKEIHSAIFKDHSDLVFPYTKYYLLATHFQPSFKKTLMIGGGAYTFPKYFLERFPQANMDVVEIDPELFSIAQTYFGAKNEPRMKLIAQDGRTFLNENEQKYDIIFGDAFASYFSPPFELTTKEAALKIKNGLTADGVAAINIISSIEGATGKFLRAEYKTFRSVFPQVYIFPTEKMSGGQGIQNIILVANKSQAKVDFVSQNKEMNQYLQSLWTKRVENDVEVLTDDFAPTDRYLGDMLLAMH